MSEHWSKETDSGRTHMLGEGLEVWRSSDPNLDPNIVYFVRVCSFTFEFGNLSQLEVCLQFYRQKTHPSSSVPGWRKCGGDHWEMQRWFEKLPLKFQNNHCRPRIVKALEKALADFGQDSRYPSKRSTTIAIPPHPTGSTSENPAVGRPRVRPWP
jgi:hypothetical protein